MILNAVTWEGPLTKEDVFEQRPKNEVQGRQLYGFLGEETSRWSQQQGPHLA